MDRLNSLLLVTRYRGTTSGSQKYSEFTQVFNGLNHLNLPNLKPNSHIFHQIIIDTQYLFSLNLFDSEKGVLSEIGQKFIDDSTLFFPDFALLFQYFSRFQNEPTDYDIVLRQRLSPFLYWRFVQVFIQETSIYPRTQQEMCQKLSEICQYILFHTPELILCETVRKLKVTLDKYVKTNYGIDNYAPFDAIFKISIISASSFPYPTYLTTTVQDLISQQLATFGVSTKEITTIQNGYRDKHSLISFNTDIHVNASLIKSPLWIYQKDEIPTEYQDFISNAEARLTFVSSMAGSLLDPTKKPHGNILLSLSFSFQDSSRPRSHSKQFNKAPDLQGPHSSSSKHKHHRASAANLGIPSIIAQRDLPMTDNGQNSNKLDFNDLNSNSNSNLDTNLDPNLDPNSVSKISGDSESKKSHSKEKHYYVKITYSNGESQVKIYDKQVSFVLPILRDVDTISITVGLKKKKIHTFVLTNILKTAQGVEQISSSVKLFYSLTSYKSDQFAIVDTHFKSNTSDVLNVLVEYFIIQWLQKVDSNEKNEIPPIEGIIPLLEFAIKHSIPASTIFARLTQRMISAWNQSGLFLDAFTPILYALYSTCQLLSTDQERKVLEEAKTVLSTAVPLVLERQLSNPEYYERPSITSLLMLLPLCKEQHNLDQYFSNLMNDASINIMESVLLLLKFFESDKKEEATASEVSLFALLPPDAPMKLKFKSLTTKTGVPYIHVNLDSVLLASDLLAVRLEKFSAFLATPTIGQRGEAVFDSFMSLGKLFADVFANAISKGTKSSTVQQETIFSFLANYKKIWQSIGAIPSIAPAIIFQPILGKWISELGQALVDWTTNAVMCDNFEISAKSNLTTTSLTDLFLIYNQSKEFLLNIGFSHETISPYALSFISLCRSSVMYYIQLLLGFMTQYFRSTNTKIDFSSPQAIKNQIATFYNEFQLEQKEKQELLEKQKQKYRFSNFEFHPGFDELPNLNEKRPESMCFPNQSNISSDMPESKAKVFDYIKKNKDDDNNISNNNNNNDINNNINNNNINHNQISSFNASVVENIDNSESSKKKKQTKILTLPQIFAIINNLGVLTTFWKEYFESCQKDFTIDVEFESPAARLGGVIKEKLNLISISCARKVCCYICSRVYGNNLQFRLQGTDEAREDIREYFQEIIKIVRNSFVTAYRKKAIVNIVNGIELALLESLRPLTELQNIEYLNEMIDFILRVYDDIIEEVTEISNKGESQKLQKMKTIASLSLEEIEQSITRIAEKNKITQEKEKKSFLSIFNKEKENEAPKNPENESQIEKEQKIADNEELLMLHIAYKQQKLSFTQKFKEKSFLSVIPSDLSFIYSLIP